MDATNEKVLKQLQEYAAMYFAAIVEKNTVNGKCQLKPGIYSAREIADCVKAAFKGRIIQSSRKPINCFNWRTGEFIATYPAIIVAHKTLQIPQGSIMQILRGKRKQAHGYTFKYATKID